MDFKKKIENTKAKIKENAPAIIVFASVAAVIAVGIRHTLNTLYNTPSGEPRGEADYPDYMLIVTREARDMLREDNSYNLTHVDHDLYRLSPISTEN